MRKLLSILTRPNLPTHASGHTGAGRSSASSCLPRWSRVPLYAALLATIACCGLLRPPAASAGPLVCKPTTKFVNFGLPEHKTANFEKEADGCAQPWLSFVLYTSHIEMWVKYGGAWHKIQTTKCEAGNGPCNLSSNWSTACEGASCNKHEFHLEWEEGTFEEMDAELEY